MKLLEVLFEPLKHVYFTGVAEAGWQGGWAYAHPDFRRKEGAAGQRRCSALVLAHSDFQTLNYPCKNKYPGLIKALCLLFLFIPCRTSIRDYTVVLWVQFFVVDTLWRR